MAKVTGRYNYRDETGKLLYWKVRIEPGRNGQKKEFRFYHGEMELGRGGEPICYNLPEVIASRSIIFNEGEKQADICTAWGLCGTSFDSGAGSRFPLAMVEYFRGKRVAVLRDNDDPGLKYAEMIGKALHSVAAFVKIILLPGLPEKGDICDWIGDKAQLLNIIKTTPKYTPPPKPPKRERRKTLRNIAGDITDDMIEAAIQYPIEKLLEFNHGKAFAFCHDDSNPSLLLYSLKNKCRCHVCGKSFDPINVLVEKEGFSFKDAVRYLTNDIY